MSTSKRSRRQFVAGVGAASATLLGSVVLSGQVGAADPAQQPTPTGTPQGFKSKQGSWFAEFVTDDGRKFRGFATFTPNGGLITTGQGDMRRDAPQSVGHGKWVQNGRKIDSKVLKFVYDANGTLAAIKEEFSTGEMDESGDSFTGTTTVHTYDVNGKRIRTEKGTINSKRIGIDPIFGTS